MSEGTSFLYNGAVIDTTAIAERKDYDAAKRQAESVVGGLNGSTQPQMPMQPLNQSLLGLKLAQGFQSRGRTSGFYGSFNPHAPIHPDVIHPDRAFGHLVALEVDLSENAALVLQHKESVDWARDLIKTICGIRKEESQRRGPSIAATDVDGKDVAPWNSMMMGEGFVGLYRCLDKSANGMLVVQVRGWNDAKQRNLNLSEAMVRPSYADFSTSRAEIVARNLARRNALRILCDVAEGLGFTMSAEKAVVPDAGAVRNPESMPPPNMGQAFGNGVAKEATFSSLLATLRERPWIAVPHVENVTDVFENETTEGVVSLFDGVVSVRSAVGALVAFADGDPKTGILVCPKDKYIAEHGGNGWTARSFDPGYEVPAGAKWVAPQWMEISAVKYAPCFPIVSTV